MTRQTNSCATLCETTFLCLVNLGLRDELVLGDALREPESAGERRQQSAGCAHTECSIGLHEHLLLGGLNSVGAVADVAADVDGKVTADGARSRGERVGGAWESVTSKDVRKCHKVVAILIKRTEHDTAGLNDVLACVKVPRMRLARQRIS